MSPASPRQLFSLALSARVTIMGGALYLKHVVGLGACPLYVVQRIFFILTGPTYLTGMVQKPDLYGRCIYSVLVFPLTLSGGAVAACQVWSQIAPLDQLPTYLPSLDYMVQVLPFWEVIRLILHGTADCAQVNWALFVLSTPEWSLPAFVTYLGFSIVQLLRHA